MDEPSSKPSNPTKSEDTAAEAIAGPDWTRPIPGEKAPPRVVWDSFPDMRNAGVRETANALCVAPPSADEPQTFQEALTAFRYWLAEANRAIADNMQLRQQLARNLGLGAQFAEDELDTTVREAQLEIAQTLKELLPSASRAAKRGRPALLRIISRTLKGL